MTQIMYECILSMLDASNLRHVRTKKINKSRKLFTFSSDSKMS